MESIIIIYIHTFVFHVFHSFLIFVLLQTDTRTVFFSYNPISSRRNNVLPKDEENLIFQLGNITLSVNKHKKSFSPWIILLFIVESYSTFVVWRWRGSFHKEIVADSLCWWVWDNTNIKHKHKCKGRARLFFSFCCAVCSYFSWNTENGKHRSSRK